MGRIIIFFILCLCLLPSSVVSVTVSGLYETEVPLEDVRPESQKQAIRTALGMVLIKLTGDRFAPGNQALQPLLQRAESYRLGYKLNAEQLRLWVQFDEDTLTRDLRGLGVPVWGKERPATLLWLVIDDASGRQILGLDGNPEYLGIIDRRSRQRGIDLTYPLLDLEDAARLTPADIWGGFMQPVLAASARYPADAILTGSIATPVTGIWEGNWTGYIDGEAVTWRAEGMLLDTVIEEGIDGMTDFLAAKFMQREVLDQTSVSITVAEIQDVEQYAAVLKYLESLSIVSRVLVSQVSTGVVTFILQAHGGCPALSQAIALGRRLEPVNGDSCASYKLLP